MNDYIVRIQSMINSGYKIEKIASLNDLNIQELRQILLENDIEPCKKDKEYKHFQDAKVLKKLEKETYFYKEMAKIAKISLNKVRFLAEIYGIKPCKKAYCVVCGKEIDLSKSKVVNKYCSKRCSDKNNRPSKAKKPINKTCVYCATNFEGKPNSRYCSERCKKLYNEVEETVRWLRG